MATLKLIGVAKSFGATRVLERVDLDVSDGEFIVLVGPSGCGKSTLLRCIAGLEIPTEGSVSIGGSSVTGTPRRCPAGLGLLRPGRRGPGVSLEPRQRLYRSSGRSGCPARDREDLDYGSVWRESCSQTSWS